MLKIQSKIKNPWCFPYGCWTKNRKTNPKWMVKIMEIPIKHGMICGVKNTPLFWFNTHIFLVTRNVPRQEFILKVWRRHGLGTRLWIALIPPWHFWSRKPVFWVAAETRVKGGDGYHDIQKFPSRVDDLLLAYLIAKWCISWVHDTFCPVPSWRVWWLVDLGCPLLEKKTCRRCLHLPVELQCLTSHESSQKYHLFQGGK